jgi:hypothetical protein
MGKSLGRPSTRGASIAACLLAVLIARPAAAHPEHLAAGGQYFDASPSGFQDYLNSIKTTNPNLFAQLAPDADQLEKQVVLGRTLIAIGMVAGAATTLAGFAADNRTTTETCTLVGAGLLLTGAVAGVAVGPSRDDLVDLVNKHNRLTPPPLQLQLGYDPAQHLASAGATLSF